MNKHEIWSIVIIAIGNVFLSKPIYSIGIGFLLLTLVLIAIYNEVKEKNKGE